MTATVGEMRTPNPPGPAAALVGTADLGASLRDDFGWLLSRAGHGLGNALGRAIEDLGLGVRGFVILKTLRTTSAPTQRELGQCTGIDKTTLVAVLDQLQARNLVRRRPDPRDRRAHVVELTDEGAEMLARATAVAHDLEAAVLAALEPDERATLLRSLRHVVEATQALGAEGGSCV